MQPREHPAPTPDSKPRPMFDTVRRLFRAAVAAVTRRVAKPQPKPRRRSSSGETRQAFGLAAKAIMRRVIALPPEAYAAATDYLSDTLDWLNLWQDNSECSDEPDIADTEQNYLSPHP